MSIERIPPARPRRQGELTELPHCPDVVEAAQQRHVTRVVHFTTRKGAIGILATKALKSRARLTQDEYLEHIYRPNAANRKGTAWLDYVNLSIEWINDWMFDASESWHSIENNPWVLLSFNPDILGHPGVVFTTTNNIYPACNRAEGLAGFRQMFSETVYGRYGYRHDRTDKLPAWTTDRQAEVLYPGQVPIEYLQRIDVQKENAVDSIEGVLSGLRSSPIPVRHAPEEFE